MPNDVSRTPSARGEPVDVAETREGDRRTEPAREPTSDPGEQAPAREDRAPGESPDRGPVNEEPGQLVRRRRRRWVIASVVAAILLAAASAFAWDWYTELRWLESTDDAYTEADATIIAPQVAGYVTKLFVTDNQQVKAGELLLQIDPRDFKAAVAKAEADVNSAKADIRTVNAQIALQQSVIAQARADLAAAKANLTYAEQQNARFQTLARQGYGTVERAQQAAADLLAKQATAKHDQSALAAETKRLAVLNAERAKDNATLQANRAALTEAKLDLGHTEVRSPIAGAVGDRAVEVGQYVQPGMNLMTIVPLGSRIYVTANFKETEIERMFRGENVDVTVDSFPGVHLHGKVDSLSPGSGMEFALLPPENATGNFTKIVQRVPVKIVLHDKNSPILAQLRPGLSVTATVDTRTVPAGAQTLVPGPKTR